MASRWKPYADDLRDPTRGVHVTVEYQTHGGAPGAWARWTEADDITEALDAANVRGRGFKRVARIYGGNAAPHRSRI